MRAIKTAAISILVAGLLAGSAVGVAARDESSEAAPAFFSWTLGEGEGEFTEGTFDGR